MVYYLLSIWRKANQGVVSWQHVKPAKSRRIAWTVVRVDDQCPVWDCSTEAVNPQRKVRGPLFRAVRADSRNVRGS